jgi:hypothetical protein
MEVLVVEVKQFQTSEREFYQRVLLLRSFTGVGFSICANLMENRPTL